MFMKKPRHRVFDYPPRFYKPDEDEQEKRKRRLGFSRSRKHGKKRSTNPIIWLILIALVIWILIKLKGI